MRIGGLDFFTSDPGKAALSTWDGDVWIVSGIDDSLERLEWKRFAAGGHETLGLCIVDDVIYTVADDEITRYHDLNGDGEADYYENFNNDWERTSARTASSPAATTRGRSCRAARSTGSRRASSWAWSTPRRTTRT
jgi:hypothetical protein